MGNFDALDVAKRELAASLEQLPPDARFAVVFYDLAPEILLGDGGLALASGANKERVLARLPRIVADGGTDPSKALEAAFALGPEVVYLLTDGRDLTGEDVGRLSGGAAPPRVHVVEFGSSPSPEGSAIARLAAETGGTYRLVDVRRISREAAR